MRLYWQQELKGISPRQLFERQADERGEQSVLWIEGGGHCCRLSALRPVQTLVCQGLMVGRVSAKKEKKGPNKEPNNGMTMMLCASGVGAMRSLLPLPAGGRSSDKAGKHNHDVQRREIGLANLDAPLHVELSNLMPCGR